MAERRTPEVNQTNIQQWTGVAATYDEVRPSPPTALLDVLLQLAEVSRPCLVVDLGSGTGLSTWAWSARAERVIGVEPNDEMRGRAERRATETGAENVSFRAGSSLDTGLPDACADIVTVSQALHWMEPAPTFAEVARVLRPGGVFAAYDYDWAPVILWEVDRAWEVYAERSQRLRDERLPNSGRHAWPKSEHLARLRASGHFRFVREFALHSVESGDARRLVALAQSNSTHTLLREGVATEEEMGVPELRRVAERYLGGAAVPWYFTYRVRVGVK